MGFLNTDGSLSKTCLDSLRLSETLTNLTKLYILNRQDQSKTRDYSNEISSLVSGITKATSPRYQAAMDRIKDDRLAWRRDKALKRLRKQMSAQRFMEVQNAMAELNHLELMEFLDNLDKVNGH